MKREKEESYDKYPWLHKDDERRDMSNNEILKRKKDLDKSCLSETERNNLMDMQYMYKDAFSLEDEVGTCQGIEIEIDVIDEFPFFIRPHQTKEEDKASLDKEMKWLCYFGIINEFVSTFKSRHFINRKVMKDRAVTYYRHLNVGVTKTTIHILY